MTDITYNATLTRPREMSSNFVLKCKGIVISYNASLENGTAMLAKQMLDSGCKEGALHIQEIGTNKDFALVQDLPSLTELANRPLVFSDAEQIEKPKVFNGLMSDKQHEALILCPISVIDWEERVHVKTRIALADRGWILIENEIVTSTLAVEEIQKMLDFKPETKAREDKPARVIKVQEPSADKLPPFNARWLDVLGKLRIENLNLDQWGDLHGKLRNSLIGNGMVEVVGGKPVITSLGKKYVSFRSV